MYFQHSDGRTTEWTDGRTNAASNTEMRGRIFKPSSYRLIPRNGAKWGFPADVVESVDQLVDGRTDRRTDGRTDGGQMDGRTDAYRVSDIRSEAE